MRLGITFPSEIDFSNKMPGEQSPSASDELVHGRGSHRQPACAEVSADGSGVRQGEWGLGKESGELPRRDARGLSFVNSCYDMNVCISQNSYIETLSPI